MDEHDYELSPEAVRALAEIKKEATEIQGVLDSALAALEADRDEHQDAFDERPERSQDSKRGQEIIMWITDLDTLIEAIGTAQDALRTIEDTELEEEA